MSLRPVLILGVLLAAACGKPDAAKPVSAASPATPVASAAAAPSLPSPLDVGSQKARDAYYCAGLLGAAYPMPNIALSPDEMAQVFRAEAEALALGVEGFGLLMDEKAALAPQAGQVADAWADVAAKEFAAKKPRIPLKTCEERAMKLPAN